MSVLVTGASGLVGSHVVEALARGEPCARWCAGESHRRAAARAEAVVGDVTDPVVWQLRRAASRHCARRRHRAAPRLVEQYVAVNVDATRLAVAAARAAGARLIHISSVAVYAVRRPILRYPSGGMKTSPSSRSRRPTSTPQQANGGGRGARSATHATSL